MNNGVLNRVMLCGLLGVAAVGCGSSDEKPNCGTAQAPKAIELKNISPALGASVPNSGIVQTFTLVGQHLQLDPSFVLPTAHTAGSSTPAPLHWTITISGADTVYTSEPFAWQTAPAHVELDSSGLLETSDGCISALPSKVFQYDVSAP